MARNHPWDIPEVVERELGLATEPEVDMPEWLAEIARRRCPLMAPPESGGVSLSCCQAASGSSSASRGW